MSGDHNQNQTSVGWRKRQIALDIKAENARELGLLELAKQAGLHIATDVNWMPIISLECAEKFANLVDAAARADEREACAKLAAKTVCDVHIPSGVKIYGTVAAKAIRERGQA